MLGVTMNAPTPSPAPHAPSSPPPLRRRHKRALVRGCARKGVATRTVSALLAMRMVYRTHGSVFRTDAGRRLFGEVTAPKPGVPYSERETANLRRLVHS